MAAQALNQSLTSRLGRRTHHVDDIDEHARANLPSLYMRRSRTTRYIGSRGRSRGGCAGADAAGHSRRDLGSHPRPPWRRSLVGGDEELKRQSARKVDERIAPGLATAEAPLLAGRIDSDAGDPRERQIARGLARYQAERAHQREILQQIADMRLSNAAVGRAPIAGPDQFSCERAINGGAGSCGAPHDAAHVRGACNQLGARASHDASSRSDVSERVQVIDGIPVAASRPVAIVRGS
jgi:hypothetical protein